MRLTQYLFIDRSRSVPRPTSRITMKSFLSSLRQIDRTKDTFNSHQHSKSINLHLGVVRPKWQKGLLRASLLAPIFLISSLFTSKVQAVELQLGGPSSLVRGSACRAGAVYRVPTNNSFSGKQLDLLIEVLAEDNDVTGVTACLTTAVVAGTRVLQSDLRDTDSSDNVASMDLKITVVERNTETPVPVDRILLSAFDLDSNVSSTSTLNTGTDDIYVQSPDGNYTSSNSQVTYSAGSFTFGALTYQSKFKGRTGNCDDGPGASVDVSCRAGAIKIKGSTGVNNTVSDIVIRLQNDNAYGNDVTTSTNLRRFQLSFEVTELAELINANTDYGDAPISYGRAGHSVGGSIALGYGIPPDNDAADYSSGDALGDNNNGSQDEDGVQLNGSALTGQTLSTGQNNLSVTTFGTGYLSAWIDLNGDGDFNDAGEKVVNDLSITNTGVLTSSVPITIPNTASGGNSFIRFRFSASPGAAATGLLTAKGEVEDYQVSIGAAVVFTNGTCQADGLVWVSGGDVANNKINQIGNYRISNGVFTSALTTARDWGDIAWATDNKLYGVEYTDISGSLNPSALYQINSTTGQTTFVTDLSMLGRVANSLSGIPNGGLLIGGDFYSKVYRYELSSSTNPPVLWHDFGTGFPAGDFIPFNGKVYIAWNTGAAYQLYEVTVDANYNYVSHRDLGALPDGSRGLALVLNKIYAVANTNIHQIDSIPTSPVTTISTTIVPNMPAPYFLGGASGTEEPFGGCRQASNPNLLLVKRITAIGGSTTNGGISLNSYDPETDTTNLSYPYDKNVIQSGITPPSSDKWPNTSGTLPLSSTFLLGARNGGTTKPKDSIEYTVYFLSTGTSPANNVLFCDRVPDNVTFSPNTFTDTTAGGIARGIAVQIGSTLDYRTNTGDSDFAQYFPPGIEPSTVYSTINCGGANNNGAVVVKLGDLNNATGIGTPPDSAGFVRFRGVVK